MSDNLNRNDQISPIAEEPASDQDLQNVIQDILADAGEKPGDYNKYIESPEGGE